MVNVIGKIPEFTTDDSPSGEPAGTGVKADDSSGEKETPAGSPPEKEPASEITQQEEAGDDAKVLTEQLQGMQEERVKLLKEIQELRGTRRELKEAQLQKVEETIEELKDVHPADLALIEKILRSKGYVTKEETNRMFYESVKQEELNKFLEKYPEYKPENDRNDEKWGTLQREMAYYRSPENPHQVGEILERAHRAIQRTFGDQRATAQKQRQIETAAVGGGGVQRSSSGKTLNSRQREELMRGGWSEEEIKRIETRL